MILPILFKYITLNSFYLMSKAKILTEQMANERTFLAWLRTSLSLVTVGIGIVQLFKLNKIGEDDALVRLGKPVGVGFTLLGIYTLIQGCIRYFRVQSMLISSLFPVSQLSIGLVGLIVLILVFVTFIFVLTTN